MRFLPGLCAALLLTGCATGRPTAPPTGAIDLAAECSRASRLSEAGEHKPAVDALDAVHRAGATCDPAVLEAVEESLRRLAAADHLVRRGLDQRSAGDTVAARESFRRALAVYPRYYWVQKLEQDLPEDPSPRSPSEESDACLDEARQAQRTGDLAGAISWTQQALAARPEEPAGRERAVDFARRLGLTLFSSGELLAAQALWEAARALDPADKVLLQYLHEVEARLQSLEEIQGSTPP